MERVVLSVPSSTMSTIVLTAFAERRSVGDMKLPAALFTIRVGSCPKRFTHSSIDCSI